MILNTDLSRLNRHKLSPGGDPLTSAVAQAHWSNFPQYLISHGKLVYTFKYLYMNFPNQLGEHESPGRLAQITFL